MLLRIRQLPQPQQSTFGSHTPTRTLTCTTPSPKPQPGAPTTTTTSAFNCLPISHAHVRTHAVHMRRRAWQKLRTKKRSGAHRTDESEINVFIFVCIYTAGYGSTDTLTSSGSQLIPPSLPLIFSFDAVIINSGEGKTKRTSQIYLLHIYFLFLGFFQSFARTGYFCRTFGPLFALLFSESHSRVQV